MGKHGGLAISRRFRFHRSRLSENGRVSWRTLGESIAGEGLAHVGVDVFETVLVRAIAADGVDSAVAHLLVKHALWPGTPESYLEARDAAKARCPGGSLVDWYAQPSLAGIDGERCILAELSLEEVLSEPVEGAAAALGLIRASGSSITFLSDMHLPAGCIESLLTKHGLYLPGDELLVSCEVGASKAEGELFDHWLRLRQAEPGQTLFIGNNRWSDVAIPRSLGIPARYVSNADCNRYEAVSAGTGPLGAAIASAATRSRLALDPQGIDPHVELGASVAGQVFLQFLLSIRARARAEGITQLAFVARDGELPLRMAEALPESFWEGMSLQYVHGNRLTWTLAGATSAGVDAWIQLGRGPGGFLDVKRHEIPLEQLLGRLGLELSDVPSELALASLGERLTPDRDDAWEELLKDDRVRALILERSQDRFDLAADYLRSIELRPEPTMVIDIGWRGQTAALVSAIFADVTGSEPLNYHFGGYGVKPEIDALCRLERFAFDDSIAPVNLPSVECCVEMFTSMGQPRARRYERVEGAVEAVLDDGDRSMRPPERERMWAAALLTAECFVPTVLDLVVDELQTDLAPATTRILELFWSQPTRRDALAGKVMLAEMDDGGGVLHPLTAPYRFAELIGPRGKTPRRWRAGSIVASPWPLRLGLSAGTRLRSIAT